MSYVFEASDTTVWSPGLRVGALYVRVAECLADWIGLQSGLDPMASDYYVINVDAFATFVRALLTDPGAAHPIFSELTRGFIVTSLVMLSRVAAPVPALGPGADQLTELMPAIASKMPT
jgi:hypothetical protein